MKRVGVLLTMLVLLCACIQQPASEPIRTPAPTAEAAPVVELLVTSAPTDAVPIAVVERIAEPAAQPTIDPFAAHFSDEPNRTERSYIGRSISVTVQSYAVDKTYGRHVTYHVADIYVRDVTAIRAEAARGDFGTHETRPVKEIAQRVGALIAIGGDSYTRGKNSFVIRNGVLYRDKPIENTDLCILYRDGTMETKQWGTFTVQEIVDADPWQVWGFGPALLDENGKSMEIQHELMGHNPRTAIGYYEPGHYCFVVVDGRGESVGVTLHSLSRLMEDLGCKVAYNLDGGASALLYWDGAIVSSPCSETRVIGDIIYLLPEE